MKSLYKVLTAATVVLAANCMAKEPPTQVIYRFDDHRYLELKGWDCEGEKTGYQNLPSQSILSNIYATIHPSF